MKVTTFETCTGFATSSNCARWFIALASFALLTACEAQKPLPPEERAFNKPQINVSEGTSKPRANAGEPKTYSEPTVIGKIIDAETKLPIQGAMIYGFYATSSGTLAGGSKLGEHVKSFEVTTDANGQFKLEAWSTGERKVGGLPNGKFPMLAIYKPGYQLWFDHMDSIKQYRPKSGVEGTEAVRTETSIDWSAYPHRLTPAKTEAARYEALSNSGVPMMMVGACGWEAYAGTLLAQHDELKDWYRRNAPSEYLKADGYPNGAMARPVALQRIDMVFESSVDRLLRIAKESGNTSKCADPRKVFQK